MVVISRHTGRMWGGSAEEVCSLGLLPLPSSTTQTKLSDDSDRCSCRFSCVWHTSTTAVKKELD